MKSIYLIISTLLVFRRVDVTAVSGNASSYGYPSPPPINEFPEFDLISYLCDGKEMRYGLNGTSNDDCIFGTPAADTLYGNGGDDIIFGMGGDDVLTGGAGADTIYGGSGCDIIDGGPKEDLLYGEGGPDIIYGGPHDDVIYGSTGSDTLYGKSGDDIIRGGEGDDVIHGGKGKNTLIGNMGGDTIYGGPDIDNISGGAGENTLFIGMLDKVESTPAGKDEIINDHAHKLEIQLAEQNNEIQQLKVEHEGLKEELKMTKFNATQAITLSNQALLEIENEGIVINEALGEIDDMKIDISQGITSATRDTYIIPSINSWIMLYAPSGTKASYCGVSKLKMHHSEVNHCEVTMSTGFNWKAIHSENKSANDCRISCIWLY